MTSMQPRFGSLLLFGAGLISPAESPMATVLCSPTSNFEPQMPRQASSHRVGRSRSNQRLRPGAGCITFPLPLTIPCDFLTLREGGKYTSIPISVHSWTHRLDQGRPRANADREVNRRQKAAPAWKPEVFPKQNSGAGSTESKDGFSRKNS